VLRRTLLSFLRAWALAAVWSAGAAAQAGEWSLRFRTQAGEEYDSNAQRLQQFGTAQHEGDFLTRLVLGGELDYADPALRFQADYTCGAKLFYRQTREHMVANQLDLSLLHVPRPGRQVGLRLALVDTTQAEHVRDYLQLRAEVLTRLLLLRRLSLELSAGGYAFRFKPSPELYDHAGPTLGLSLQLPLEAGFSLSLGYHFGVRFFRTQADPPGGSRQDERHEAGTRLRFQTEWWDGLRLLAQLGYDFTANLSNSEVFESNWHRLELVVAMQLPWDLTLHLLGRVQLTNGIPLISEPDADENENAFVGRLAWRFWGDLQLVAQVAVYRNTFPAGDALAPNFARETYLLGLAWDWTPF
jgi:hypothetical protein